MRMIRIVRSFTGRDKIGIFSGAWHGSHDFLLIDDDAVGPEDKPNPGFRSSGIPESLLDLIVLLPSNSESAFNIIYDNYYSPKKELLNNNNNVSLLYALVERSGFVINYRLIIINCELKLNLIFNLLNILLIK